MSSTELDNRWQEDSEDLCGDIFEGGSITASGETQTDEGAQQNLTTNNFEDISDVRYDMDRGVIGLEIDLSEMDNRWRDKKDDVLMKNVEKNDDRNLVTVDEMMRDDEKGMVTVDERSDSHNKDLCTHNTRRYCNLHKIKGDRKETKLRVWRKKI